MTAIKRYAAADKDVQRNFFLEKRKILLKNKDEKTALDREIQSRLILSREYREASAVLVYASREHEIATSMIINAAFANNKLVAMPRCEDKRIMRFYTVRSAGDLVPGSYGIMEPSQSCELFEPDERSLCVCPCLCSDMSGYRLGFGGGYYDIFLNDFPGFSAALCYSDAVIPEISRDDGDVPVKMIVTDSFVRRIN